MFNNKRAQFRKKSLGVLRFKGGLGNQLFQYSFYLNIKENFEIFYFDFSFYKKDKRYKNISPEIFNIVEFNLEEFDWINSKSNNALKFLVLKSLLLFKRFFLKIFMLSFSQLNFFCIGLYSELNPSKLSTMKFKEISYFDGYYQNFEFPINVESELIKNLKFYSLNEIKGFNDKLSLDKFTCSLHWRRGDYINNKLLGHLDENYYKSAVLKMKNLVNLKKILVFSDDIDSVRKYFFNKDFLENIEVIFIDDFFNLDVFSELILMSRCENNIISNSTYSWWAAFINRNLNKIIIAPNNWVSIESRLKVNVIPYDWFRV